MDYKSIKNNVEWVSIVYLNVISVFGEKNGTWLAGVQLTLESYYNL